MSNEKKISELKKKLESETDLTKQMSIQQEIESLEKGTEVVKKEDPKTEILNRSNIKTWQDAMKALPSGLSATPLNENRIQIEVGHAAQLIRKAPKLKECTPTSIFDAVVFAARIGLTLNPAMQLCHLVPRKGVCCLDIDYKGWIAIIRDSKIIKDAFANIVYEDEEFDRRPAEGIFVHIPKDAASEEEHNKRKMRGAYSILVFPDGSRSEPEWIPAWELEKIAKVSPAYSSDYSPRKNWKDEMHKKSCFKRHIKKFRTLQNDDRIEAMFEHEQQQFENKKPVIAKTWDIEDAEEVTSE